MKTKQLITLLASAAIAAGSANAATVISASSLTPNSYTTVFDGTYFTADTGNMLNDNSVSSSGYADTANVGYRHASSSNDLASFTFDFGQTVDISSVVLYINDGNNFHLDDMTLSVYTSVDDITYSAIPVTVTSIGGAGLVERLDINTVTWGLSANTSSLADGRYVRLDLIDVGIWNFMSEIDFEGTAVPEASTAALLGLVGLALIARRRR